ncbi:putative uncharacterized protein [Burkholderiales bacterium GJ-E10]|nr:putative uncharacterized protein [Burkholderiales bacterium GJ-E10]
MTELEVIHHRRTFYGFLELRTEALDWLEDRDGAPAGLIAAATIGLAALGAHAAAALDRLGGLGSAW